MTAVSSELSPSTSGIDVLTHRLEVLQLERDAALEDTRGDAGGDMADRATHVEASIRLSILDDRIAQLQLEIAELGRHPHVDGVVSLGDTVVLDLGDGPERFVLGSVEYVGEGLDAVTPSSPLGQAILGASVGSTVTYSPRKGASLSATVVSLG